ncbi:hypothetical protein SDC9_125373 [bioreactor metagenome]|uniref:Uncharacterized protein n=1 Tax=bioreactor metagenome TaxID=1076179 RepID=A0A645CNL4_9ZZZZ
MLAGLGGMAAPGGGSDRDIGIALLKDTDLSNHGTGCAVFFRINESAALVDDKLKLYAAAG